MDLPTLAALERYWRHCPPPSVQLARIGLALGLKPPDAPAAKSRGITGDGLRDLAAAGLPIQEGRPDDPMLAFLDL